MKYCLLIQKKGFNYYTDYTEKYMGDVMEKQGFHVIRDADKADIFMNAYISENIKLMAITSDYFDSYNIEEMNSFAALVSEHFKSSVTVRSDIPAEYSAERPYIIMFSSRYSAFDEPPFVTEGNTFLKQDSYSLGLCTMGEPHAVSCQNYGGISKGLDVYIYGGFVKDDEVTFEVFELNYYDYKNKKAPLVTINGKLNKCQENGIYYYSANFEEFEIPEGINTKSAQLKYKRGHEEKYKREFWIRFIPHGDKKYERDIEVVIVPTCNKDNIIRWRPLIPFFIGGPK